LAGKALAAAVLFAQQPFALGAVFERSMYVLVIVRRTNMSAISWLFTHLRKILLDQWHKRGLPIDDANFASLGKLRTDVDVEGQGRGRFGGT
jgi:hypothetical protein